MKKILVVGAGHAGIEAACAVVRMGHRATLITTHLETIGQMSCNPSIGGIAKGHLVREIDALGGVMPRLADLTCIHFKTLNRSKGPAVRASRTQNEKSRYREEAKRYLENQPRLEVYQSIVTAIRKDHHRTTGVELIDGHFLSGDAVIICTGTFLQGLIYIGHSVYPAGRANEPPATELGIHIRETGFKTIRLKTGTPMRIHHDSIGWKSFTPQPGDPDIFPFSFFSSCNMRNQVTCRIGHTNERVHEIIRDNIHRSPLFSGQIQGIGPRYCPSIEDKVIKFPHRQNHQFFLEPEGVDNREVYLSGLSTSLPVSVQEKILAAIPGFENAVIMRPGYAIEYDAIDSTQLKPSLESRLLENLYFAGQVNGTSGYEEAAAQGLMAGINASLKVRGDSPLILERSEAYIGVLIDDLIHKGVDEPYRLFTSRAEFRLNLREDNAFERLGRYGLNMGLIDPNDYERVQKFLQRRENALSILSNSRVQYGGKSRTLQQLLKRPDFDLSSLQRYLEKENLGIPSILKNLSPQDRTYVEARITYEGYIRLQNLRIKEESELRNIHLPASLDYHEIQGLSTEIRQKLSSRKPPTLYEAYRIPGVTPAAIHAISIHLKIRTTRSL